LSKIRSSLNEKNSSALKITENFDFQMTGTSKVIANQPILGNI